MATLDRFFPMTNNFFCDGEINRLRLVVLLLKKTKHRLVKLQLGFIDGERLEQESEEFKRLVDEMISLLIQCSKLTSLRFDYEFCLPKAKFEHILQHLGPQLVELYCDYNSSLRDSYEFAMKYLDPLKAKKLAVDYGNSDAKIERFLKRFPFLTSFRNLNFNLNPNFSKLMPNLSEFTNGSWSPAFLQTFMQKSESCFNQKLVFFQLSSKLNEKSFDNFKNFRSLRYLIVDQHDPRFPFDQHMSDIVQYLPQLELFVCHYLTQDTFLQIYEMKNLKVLEIYDYTGYLTQIKPDPMPNIEFLLVSVNRFDPGSTWEVIATVFPNIKCLDIRCWSYRPDLLVAALLRLPKLRRLRLHCFKPLKAVYSIEESFLNRQKVKSFCDEKNTEFLWSYFERSNDKLPDNTIDFSLESFFLGIHIEIGFEFFKYLKGISQIIRTLPNTVSFDWL